MTLRLVGLMSIVLLLSLAAFAVLIDHYQDGVMEELPRTVSAAGRAALNSFAYRVAEQERPGAVWVERRVVTGDLAGAEVAATETGGERAPGGGRPVGQPMVVFVDEQRARSHTGESHDGEGTERRVVILETMSSAGDGDDPAGVRWTYSVQVDGVRAEEDPSKGILLKIPTLRSGAAVADVHVLHAETPGEAGAAPAGAPLAGGPIVAARPRIVDARQQEIVLPISTEDYRELFSRFERRSMFVFLGVFVLGTALSAGLASRFTRPIRRLDGAIHRIAEGELDATVEVHGRDEIARLGQAFNAMTTRLRAGRERERELTRREKLSALGRLAAGVAHDVRNPLHSIGLTLQHVQETCRPEDPERQRELDRALRIIREEIGRLDALVESFLRFASSDRRERRPVDLATLARETAALVRKEAEWRGIEIELRVDGDVPAVPADPESIRSSVLNLVLNSFEALPDGGRVTLAVSAAPGGVQLAVSDDGVGIPDAEREKVFEFAYSTREGGHGLGLAMVHQCVVEDHGGRVRLDSAPGEGTRVVLSLPVEAAVS